MTASNPLEDLINQETFELLSKEGLLNKKKVREYQIIAKYHKLKSMDVTTQAAMGMLLEEFPDLCFETIKKITYFEY
ncbi:MAG: hypothetical protein HF314_12995 [Ignavibacteria bacterium]|jgi:hypothetical protein|nr:hypothetical protein [Ignavibacteria bacterium]MCU7503992.1 hypothetical protein [Ignavibacteria bacterium]MCU7515364.1 hypothetical protein [Ignavibacteria bacterium]